MHIPSKFMKLFIFWLPITIITTLLSGLIYGTVRQNIRQAANDPQIELAEDTSAALNAGIRPQSIIPAGKINIAESLAPYLIIYNESGYPLISSGQLDNQIPVPPAGVFRDAKANGQNRITWQPKPGLRNAVVVVPFEGNPSGFVLAGRSLREIEKREKEIFNIVFWGWLFANLGTLGWLFIFRNHL
jgi:hypothetical protein